MILIIILNDIQKKNPAFFPAKSATFGSKQCHQKDIFKLKPSLSTYMKIFPIFIIKLLENFFGFFLMSIYK